ncbi:Lipid A export ATP-binding/permease protein MsbA [Exiguobacterium aurantiacum]|uniref:Lipid A export ATP-binding/permease protein MsbA n=1 Tax=Exiguobacterium aurantiacum TaxID=33987 RepID=A0A377HIM4_9BACL|nr:Lipid A export ATP-binding/permease protein MsbA [Exiguobacterium aurantiacum]
MNVNNFSNIRKVGIFIKYLFSKKFFSRYLIFIGLLNILTGLVPVLYLHIFAQMIELVSEKSSFENFVLYSLFLIIIIVSLPIINDYSSIFETLYNKQLKKMLVTSTNIYYDKTDLLKIQLDQFQNKFVFIQSTDSLIKESYYLLFSSIRSLVTFFGTLYLLRDLSIWFFLVIFIGSYVSIVLNKKIGKLQFEADVNLTEHNRLESAHYSALQESKNQKYVLYNSLFKNIYFLWEEKMSFITRRKIEYQKKILRVNTLSETTLGLTFLSICIMIYFSVVNTVSSIIMVLQSINNFQNSITQLGDNITEFYNLKLRSTHIEDFLEFITSKNDLVPHSYKSHIHSIQNIQINNAGFMYPGREDFNLLIENFSISSGNIYGLLGENGKGKSTFINLLASIYSFNYGDVLLNGESVSQSDYKKIIRDHVSILFQNNLKITGNVTQNLNASLNDFQSSNLKLVRSIHDYMGLNEMILDNSFNTGTELSGGQWQHIFLARSFLKQSTSILILDEPTTFLDTRKIAMLIEDLITLKKRGWIILIITHDEKLHSIMDTSYTLTSSGRLEKSNNKLLTLN